MLGNQFVSKTTLVVVRKKLSNLTVLVGSQVAFYSSW